jgi:hypothetical protein
VQRPDIYSASRVANASALLDGVPDVGVTLCVSARPPPLLDAKGWVGETRRRDVQKLIRLDLTALSEDYKSRALDSPLDSSVAHSVRCLHDRNVAKLSAMPQSARRPKRELGQPGEPVEPGQLPLLP